MSQITFGRSVLLLIIACGVFFTELGSARLWDRDEPRNSEASREMLARGDLIVPTFNGELRAHKPILIYWGQMACYKIFGESEFTARLPSVLAALLSIFTVAVLASRLTGHPKGISQEGFWAAGALATCLMFVLAGRAATPDGLLVGCSTAGIALLVISCLAPAGPFATGHVTAARWLPAMAGYFMLGLAALAKGPVGVILPVGVVSLWWLFSYQLQTAQAANASPPSEGMIAKALSALQFTWASINPVRCFVAAWRLKLIPGMLLTLLVCVPWYYQVGVATNGDFLRGFFIEHNVGRAMNSMEGHGGSIFFYPVAFLMGTFPWSLWFIPIMIWAVQHSKKSVVHRQLIILSATWIGVYLTAFTIASTKLPSYITPCYGGAALAIGCYLRHFEIGWSVPANWQRYAAYAVSLVTGVAITGGLMYMSNLEAMPLVLRASLCGVVVVGMGIVAIVLERTSKMRYVPLTWLIGGACFQAILFGFGAKSVDQYRDDLKMLASVQNEDPTNEAWLTIGGLEPSWVYYLKNQIVEITDSPREDSSWQRVEEFLSKNPQGRIIVVGDEAQTELATRMQEITPQAGCLVQLAESERFMREGKLRVYTLGPAADPNVASDSPANAPAARVASIPSVTPDQPKLSPLPNAVPLDADTSDNLPVDFQPDAFDPSAFKPTAPADMPAMYPNPLRPQDHGDKR